MLRLAGNWSSPGPVSFTEPFRNDWTEAQTARDSVSRSPWPTSGEQSKQERSVSRVIRADVLLPRIRHPQQACLCPKHFNFSIQRELITSTVLTLAYVELKVTAHHSTGSEPGHCSFLHATHWAGLIPTFSAGALGCGPNAEQDNFQLGSGPLVYGTRNTLLNPNYCPGAQTLCFGYGNTFTHLTANSIYNAAQVTVERKAGDVTLLAAYTFAKALDASSGFGDLVNFATRG